MYLLLNHTRIAPNSRVTTISTIRVTTTPVTNTVLFSPSPEDAKKNKKRTIQVLLLFKFIVNRTEFLLSTNIPAVKMCGEDDLVP